MSLIQSLEIGKRGLGTQRTAITTAGHNIANLNTPGYARQKAVVTNVAAGSHAEGVDVISIQQIRDRFLDARLQVESQSLARSQAQSQWLSRIETFFVTDGEVPLNTALGRFWDSWQDLANDPTSQSAKEAVHQRGKTLAFEITSVRQQLTQTASEIHTQIGDSVTQLNSEIEDLAGLNQAITIAEADGASANDLRDERHRLVSSLSQKIQIQTIESKNHEFVVTAGGIELVRGEEFKTVDLQESAENGMPTASLSVAGQSLRPENGSLAGLMQLREEVLPDLRDRLDTFAEQFITQVNEQHASGYNAQHQTGLAFFSGSDSQDIAVALDADQIATASSLSSLSDNQVALQIAQLRVQGRVGGSGQTFESFFTDTAVQAGLLSQEAERSAQNQTRIVDSLEAQQQSVSGVSLDEEMTSLIQFQHAYEAAARYVTAVDELLQSVIDMV